MNALLKILDTQRDIMKEIKNIYDVHIAIYNKLAENKKDIEILHNAVSKLEKEKNADNN